MDCNCNKTQLAWVRGNSMILRVLMREPQVDEHGQVVYDHGDIVWVPIATEVYDDVTARLIQTSAYAQKPVDVEYAIEAGNSSSIIMSIPSTLKNGTYSVEVTLKKGGVDARSYEVPVFRVVETNAEAHVTFDVIEGMRSANVDLRFQLIAQAVTAGKNAYELWRELPGNEDKTLDDFIASIVPSLATHDTDGLMSKEDKRFVDALRSMDELPDTTIEGWFAD